ncbi:hypothetical protein [Clostridium sp.]|uniref:phage lytic cycle repressor MrpR family protein n=1 Tax=Clostridium sp. TaxID=1506 RepID=UPI00262B4706|nr:hypothetical protein [Clostridium sp.]
MGKREVKLDTNIYDYEAKLLFIDSFQNVSSQKAYKSMLVQMGKYEKEIDKEFYNMTINEMKDCIDTLSHKTINSADSLLSKLGFYLFWAISNNLADNNAPEVLGWLKTLKGEDIVSKTAMGNQYLTKKELYTIGSAINNSQNEALIILLFHGVEGIEMSELRNIKKSDIDFAKNIIHLHGYSPVQYTNGVHEILSRDIELSIYEMGIIKSALMQLDYSETKLKEKDGQQIEKIYTYNLVDTEYLFKNRESLKGKTSVGNVSRNELNKRIREISSIVKIPLTAGNILDSGKIYELTQLNKEIQDITDEDYTNILKKYNMQINPSSIFGLRQLYEYLVKNEIGVAIQ